MKSGIGALAAAIWNIVENGVKQHTVNQSINVIMVFNFDFNSISATSPSIILRLSGISLSSTWHNFLPKLLAAFPHNIRKQDRQR